MKNKIFALFSCLLALSGMAGAQDFGPSEQAQGYLNDKNVTVDHVTGIFHYKVPLYTLGQEGFQLPVYLEYTANGVREEDTRGLISQNWTLNVGGVVTRTIRGGIADEKRDEGYLWAENATGANLLEDDVTRVDKRERDGESDIFTAVFNGQAVHFVLRMGADRVIRAEALERTNVRIDCESTGGHTINGWIVTDEDGNRYIYREKELFIDVAKENAISFNGVREQSYISAWYLNRVEPVNGEPIIFSYLKSKKGNGHEPEVSVQRFFSRGQAKYEYGKAMHERPFDFSKYQNKFYENINLATEYASAGLFSKELDENYKRYLWRGEWVRNPNFEAGLKEIENNRRVLGMLASFNDIAIASNELIQTLDELHNYYSGLSDYRERMAAGFIYQAKIIVINSIDEINKNITTREVANVTSFSIHSPVLDRITCGGKIIEVCYEGEYGPRRIKGIRSSDIFRRSISEVAFNYSRQLDRLSFLDKEGTETHRMGFTYYTCPDYLMTRADIWGYPKEIGSLEMYEKREQYQDWVDPFYHMVGSLKTIKTPNGGTISIAYEPNTCNFSDKPYGGIRIKSLLVEDEKNNTCDTIDYHYPLYGWLVYNQYSNQETVRYFTFSDTITYSRVKYWGNVFINTGNNGIYYPYVQEVTRGKGTRAFFFHVPLVVHYSRAILDVYPFWLVGLPLATILYDDAGNMKQFSRNTYLTDMEFENHNRGNYFPSNDNYFIQMDTTVNYRKTLPQVKAYEFFMDEEKLESYYNNQSRVFLYKKGFEYVYMNAYAEIYNPNIKPRLWVDFPEQYYNLHYGGKTLLKEQREYMFEGQVTSEPGYNDLYMDLMGVPCRKTEFFYDNLPRSVSPTRVVKTDSKGDVYTTVIKRVTEMSDAAGEAIVKMKERNMLTPVIKQTDLQNNVLLNETITQFRTWDTDSGLFVIPYKLYTRVPVTNETFTSPVIEASLFTGKESDYRVERTLGHDFVKRSCLPVGITDRQGEAAICRDYHYGQEILKVKGAGPHSVMAADLKKYNNDHDLRYDIEGNKEAFFAFRGFLEVYQTINVNEQSPAFREYTRSSGHRMMLRAIEAIVSSGETMSFDEYGLLIDSLYDNGYRLVIEFYNKYVSLSYSAQDFEKIMWCLPRIRSLFIAEYMIDPILFKYMNIWEHGDLLSDDTELLISQLPASKRLKMYVLAHGSCYVDYYIKTSSGASISKREQFSGATGYTLHVIDIDLNSYTGATSFKMSRPDGASVDYIAVIPENTTFEATSYNLDGTVFCRFSQNCQLELNEYDAAGRVVRMKDQNGNVVKENCYHVVN